MSLSWSSLSRNKRTVTTSCMWWVSLRLLKRRFTQEEVGFMPYSPIGQTKYNGWRHVTRLLHDFALFIRSDLKWICMDCLSLSTMLLNLNVYTVIFTVCMKVQTKSIVWSFFWVLSTDRYDRLSDIFAYGIILLRLISKRAYERDYLKRKESGDPGTYGWAEEYWARYTDIVFRNQRKISLVHQSLRAHPTFDFADGLKITSLAMRCVNFSSQRPRMKGIVKSLLKLNVVRQYWDFLDCDKMLSFLDVEFLSQG